MRRFSSLLFLMIILLNINTVTIHAKTADASFDDIKGHWAEEYIIDLYDKKIIFGNDKNNFEPDKEISIMEFLSMRKRLKSFWDLPSEDPYYQDFPMNWEERGYLDKQNWFYDLLPMFNHIQSFHSLRNGTPTDKITREEAWRQLLSYDIPFQNYPSYIKISKNMREVIWDWDDYYPNNGYITEFSTAYLVVLGVIVPKKDFPHHTMPSLNPMKRITKGESAELISLFIEKMEQEKEIDTLELNPQLDQRPLDMHISIPTPNLSPEDDDFYVTISATSNKYFFILFRDSYGSMHEGDRFGRRSANEPLKGDGYLLITDKNTILEPYISSFPVSKNDETLHLEAWDRLHNVIKEWDIPVRDLILNGYSD